MPFLSFHFFHRLIDIEGHYPEWGCEPLQAPERNADNRRRLAWSMVMAGGYQTTGERAGDYGGWLNGYGKDSSGMLMGYQRILNFFENIEWWKLEPQNDLVTFLHYCLYEPGKQYVVYIPEGKTTSTVHLQKGNYTEKWYNPRDGSYTDLPSIHAASIDAASGWTSPETPSTGDWVLLIRKL